MCYRGLKTSLEGGMQEYLGKHQYTLEMVGVIKELSVLILFSIRILPDVQDSVITSCNNRLSVILVASIS